MTFIAVRCPHCQSDHIVKRGKTARGTQRYLCQNTHCTQMAIQPTPDDPRLSLRPAPSRGDNGAPSPRSGGQGVACLWWEVFQSCGSPVRWHA